MKVEGNNIKLLITNAAIRAIEVRNNGSVSAYVDLKVGSKVLTSVRLSNDSFLSEGDPSYLDIKEDVSDIVNRLFSVISKSAVISLEHIQNMIGE